MHVSVKNKKKEIGLEKVKLIFVIAFLTGMLILFFQKERILNNVSNISAKAILNNPGISDSNLIYEQFKLEKDGSDIKGSFLEFGAKNCLACRRMEKVVDEIKIQYNGFIDVHFYNVTERDGLELGRQFGVVMIPMQVLLDKNGQVVYKHVGYISSMDLAEQINLNILNK